MTKRKSTIIIGIFLIISILFVAWLIPFNLKEQFAGLAETLENLYLFIMGQQLLGD